MKTALLGSRGVLRVSGPEAADWLQGLITNDIGKADGESACFAALLSAQGKILFDFLISRHGGAGEEEFLVDCAGDQAAALARRMSMYRLRARVEIADVSAGMGVVAIWDTPDRPSPDARRDPRNPALGWRMIGPRTQIALQFPPQDSEDGYHAMRVAAGVPEGGSDYPWGDAFPHDVNMDELNGVDFKKGCYIGQEVVSRVQHRGTARKRIRKLAFNGSPPATGAAITAGEIQVGTVTSVSGETGLGQIRIDRAADAREAGTQITADGNPVQISQ
ncbi:MAG: folate-binding protein YgfZ [Hyphomicrobiales bacterium]|nr:folate-binding protein YgfZ [Hyphomicrobiales bacterium]